MKHVNINQSDHGFAPVWQTEKLSKRLISAVFYLSCIKPKRIKITVTLRIILGQIRFALYTRECLATELLLHMPTKTCDRPYKGNKSFVGR